VVAAVERVTWVRRRLATKIIADCPLCSRKGRLEVAQQPSGKVTFICHAGCDREALRETIGLGWEAFFEDVSYRPDPARSAAQHVLRAVSGIRWTLTTHAFGESDRDLALAVEIVERLLPARHRVRSLLRRKHGTPIAWHEFPLTASFVMNMATKLGTTIGEHRAYRLIHLLLDHGLIEQAEVLPLADEDGYKGLPIFRLPLRTIRSWDKSLRDALEAGLVRSPGSRSKHPATGTVLSSGCLMSSLAAEVRRQVRAARAASGALGRSPPVAAVVERVR
jgi:hypothetical protein